METKQNIKYYTAPPFSIPTIIGWIFTAVMVIVAIVGPTIPGVLGSIVGLGIVIFTSGGKSTDTDIEYQARERIKDLQENSMKKNDVYDKHFLKMLKPVDLAGYDFEAAESLFLYKKGNDGTPRTNYFAGYNLIFTGEKMYIYGRRLSLTDETIDNTITATYKYTELDRAEIETKTFTPEKGEPVEYHVFKIYAKNGDVVLDTCIDYGADSDKAMENINRAITIRCAELEKKAEERAQKLAEFREKVMNGTADLPEDTPFN